MLLRSITKHVKDQNWFAVGLDFFIVVAGILIAFQITNWNEGRSNAIEERALLQQLSIEFEQIEAGAKDSIDFQKNTIAGLTTIAATLDAGQLDENDRALFEQGLLYGYTLYTSSDRSTVLGEIISSGKSSLLKNKDLLRELMRYDAYLNEFASAEDIIAEQQTAFLPNFTSSFTYDLEKTVLIGGSSFKVSAIGTYDFDTMVKDRAFRNAVYELRETHIMYTNWRRRIIERNQKIRHLIDAEMATKGAK
ncbi:MAG: hypothetical protein COA91_12775 [Robiginitomaculum sp.]|nr:MAG: hypothetical protein COA91_12775 [Robiginitomaculum sp.]